MNVLAIAVSAVAGIIAESRVFLIAKMFVHLSFKHLLYRSCKQLFQLCLNIFCAFTVCPSEAEQAPFPFRLIRDFCFSYQFTSKFLCGYYCHLHSLLFRLLYFYYKDEMHCEYAPIFSQQHIPQQRKAEYSALKHYP